MKLQTESGTTYEVTIENFYYRESDGQSFILYRYAGPLIRKLILTNGIHAWQVNLEEKLEQLLVDWERCDVDGIYANLKKYFPHAAITNYFNNL